MEEREGEEGGKREVKGEGRGEDAWGDHDTNDLVFHPYQRKTDVYGQLKKT